MSNKSMSQQNETERVREIFDASAAHYDIGGIS